MWLLHAPCYLSSQEETGSAGTHNNILNGKMDEYMVILIVLICPFLISLQMWKIILKTVQVNFTAF
jgi:hypothetical protein